MSNTATYSGDLNRLERIDMSAAKVQGDPPKKWNWGRQIHEEAESWDLIAILIDLSKHSRAPTNIKILWGTIWIPNCDVPKV